MNETLPQTNYYPPQGVPTPPPAAPGTAAEPFGGAATFQTSLNYELTDLVQMGIVYAFIIAAALSAVFIFIGGVSFILSGGNEEKIKSAVNTIRYSIIGLIITILSFTFVMIVGRMFGLNLMDYISYEQIKNSINQLVSGSAQEKQIQENTMPTMPTPAPTPAPAPAPQYVPPVIPSIENQ